MTKLVCVIDEKGWQWWTLNGLLHREDGPAVIGTHESWYINGLRHRENGPAIEYHNGDKEWYYNGNLIDCRSQEEFERIIKLKAFW